jgi:hypothetical protein
LEESAICGGGVNLSVSVRIERSLIDESNWQLREDPSAAENHIQHGGCQSASESVLLARVIRADQGVWPDDCLGTVSETGSWLYCHATSGQSAQSAVPSERSETNNDAHSVEEA